MKVPHLQTTSAIAVRCSRIFKLERSGKYEAALASLGDFWPALEGWPRVEGLEPIEAADIVLRCGSLIGFDGHIKQLQESQKRSEDLLTWARERFELLGRHDKVAECENYIALGYWRAGEFNEAMVWVSAALERDLDTASDTRLYSHAIANLILLSKKEYEKICQNFDALEEDFIRYADSFLKGNLYNNYGVALKNLKQTQNALEVLEIGRGHYYKSGNRIHCALAENNLAQLYRLERHYRKAHAAIDNATSIFKKLKDKTRAGFSLDTKALIYLDEGKYEEAFTTVNQALRILKRSENTSYLAETYLTKAKILLYTAGFSEAILSLMEAIQLSSRNAGDAAARKLIQDFEIELKAKDSVKLENPPDNTLLEGDLELILPASISNYAEYRGVWMNNDHLKSAGLIKGSLAIVVPDEVGRGDLAALKEIESGSISCGVFDRDFGIICLERPGAEPLLFNESDVKIVGKIVGVCTHQHNKRGKLTVETLPYTHPGR